MPIQTDENFIVEGTVVVYDNTLYYVTKVNPKNYKVIDARGTRFNLRISNSVKRAEDQDSWTGPRPNPYTNYIEAIADGLALGATVRLKSLTHRRKYGDEIYVIIAARSDGTFRMARLNGGTNEYLRGFTSNDIVLATGTFTEEN